MRNTQRKLNNRFIRDKGYGPRRQVVKVYTGDDSASDSAAWGGITGVLDNQVDLKTALDGKAALVHSHVISDVVNLQESLDSKQTPVHPGFVAGKWYCPVIGSLAAGANIGNGYIRLLPFVLPKPITLAALGARITTASAGGSFQLAIYANNAATGRPTGNPLAVTTSMSTGTAGVVSVALSASVVLPAGTYWMAVLSDNATVVFQTLAQQHAHFGQIIGSATLGNISSIATGASMHLWIAHAFGTWPDLTAISLNEATSLASAVAFLQAG